MGSNGETLSSETFSVVAIGMFNPAIFHPQWLAKNNLIRDEEADASTVKFISNDVSIIEGPWFALQVTGDRFALESLDPVQNLAARDLVVGIFKILEHTPMNAIGLNVTKQYQFKDESTWHQFGDYYAPKTTWDGVMEKAGMLNLAIVGRVKYSEEQDVPVRVVLDSSRQKTQFGVQVAINHHYQKPQPASKDAGNAGQFIEVISKNYEQFIYHVQSTLAKVFTDFTNAEKRK